MYYDTEYGTLPPYSTYRLVLYNYNVKVLGILFRLFASNSVPVVILIHSLLELLQTYPKP